MKQVVAARRGGPTLISVSLPLVSKQQVLGQTVQEWNLEGRFYEQEIIAVMRKEGFRGKSFVGV
jgi:hypothetical protein